MYSSASFVFNVLVIAIVVCNEEIELRVINNIAYYNVPIWWELSRL